MENKVYRKILPNKMRVLMIPMANTDTIAVGMFVKVGSRYETINNSGIAHFLEHMMFKGTKHMKTETISYKLDNVGARYNAETSYEHTCYYIYGHKNDTELFIKMIADIYLNPLFNKEDIEIEKGVVIEELNMTADDPSEQLHELIFSNMFTNSSLKMPIIGTLNNIKKYTQQDIIEFRSKYYIPERTVFIITGNFNKNKILNLIKGIFKHKMTNIIKQDKISKSKLYQLEDPIMQTMPLIKIKKSKVSQTSVAIVFRSHSIYSGREEIYDLLSDILTTGTSGRLFILLRNKLGAIYFVSSHNVSFMHEGIFTINIGADNNRVSEIIDKVLEELHNIKKNGVTQEELDKAKKIRITSFTLGLQTPQELLTYYGMNELIYGIDNTNTYDNIKENIKKYEKITLTEINEVADELFKKQHINIFVNGKSPKLNKIKSIN
jgi:predicted Zn-dependent peptidase